MRRICWALLLPFVLLISQQGELQHAYAHDAEAESSGVKAPSGPDHCPLCLAYAQLAGSAGSHVATATLLSGLSFHHVAVTRLASIDGEVAAPRSRGPPAHL